MWGGGVTNLDEDLVPHVTSLGVDSHVYAILANSDAVKRSRAETLWLTSLKLPCTRQFSQNSICYALFFIRKRDKNST